jgi:hypothetical protein
VSSSPPEEFCEIAVNIIAVMGNPFRQFEIAGTGSSIGTVGIAKKRHCGSVMNPSAVSPDHRTDMIKIPEEPAGFPGSLL